MPMAEKIESESLIRIKTMLKDDPMSKSIENLSKRYQESKMLVTLKKENENI